MMGVRALTSRPLSQGLGLGGVEVMFEAEHLLTQGGRSSKSNTTDAESACAFIL